MRCSKDAGKSSPPQLRRSDYANQEHKRTMHPFSRDPQVHSVGLLHNAQLLELLGDSDVICRCTLDMSPVAHLEAEEAYH